MPMTEIIEGALGGSKIVHYVVHSHDSKRLIRNLNTGGPDADITQDVVADGAICTEYDTGKRFAYNKTADIWVLITNPVTPQEETNRLLNTVVQQLGFLTELAKELV